MSGIPQVRARLAAEPSAVRAARQVPARNGPRRREHLISPASARGQDTLSRRFCLNARNCMFVWQTMAHIPYLSSCSVDVY